MKNLLLWIEKAGFCFKKNIGFQQFFKQQSQFFHAQQLNLTVFLHYNQQKKKRLFKGLGFQMKKQGCWKFSNQCYSMKSRGKSEKAFLGAGQREQRATNVPGELLIASLVQTQLLQPLQTGSVQVPRLLHIFINQTKPTQSGFFFLHSYAYRRPRTKWVHNW